MSRVKTIIKKLNKNPEREYGISDITADGLFP